VQCNFEAEISGWAIPVAFHLQASLLLSLPFPCPFRDLLPLEAEVRDVSFLFYIGASEF